MGIREQMEKADERMKREVRESVNDATRWTQRRVPDTVRRTDNSNVWVPSNVQAPRDD
jgi:hypothetical protein